MHLNLTKTLLAATLCAAPALAQSASFAPFGKGCAGSVPDYQVTTSANGNASSLQPIIFAMTSELAIEISTMPTPPLITGFELLTAARSDGTKVQCHIYQGDAQGVPGANPVATGTMVVDTKVDWYRVVFPQPFLFKPGPKLFLSWTDPRVPFSTIIQWPVPTGSAPKMPAFNRSSATSAWKGPYSSHPYAYRLLGAGAPRIPDISATGLPQLGSKFQIDLAGALPSSAAGLILGSSNKTWGPVPLPLDLGVLNASGCQLLVAFDIFGTLPIDAQGNSAATLPIPNDSGLLNLMLHAQWMVFDPQANGLGLAFTRGGTMTIGR